MSGRGLNAANRVSKIGSLGLALALVNPVSGALENPVGLFFSINEIDVIVEFLFEFGHCKCLPFCRFVSHRPYLIVYETSHQLFQVDVKCVHRKMFFADFKIMIDHFLS